MGVSFIICEQHYYKEKNLKNSKNQIVHRYTSFSVKELKLTSMDKSILKEDSKF